MTKRAQSGSQAKKFNRCTLNVRDFPLERFRLERDGRKWKQAARSRSDLLLKLSTYANSDGTFQSDEKNFSPSAKNLLRHFAEDTFYRLSNDLRELGLVSWVREQKHYGRRIYTIHLRAEKQVRYSQRNTSDIRQNTSDQQGVITPPLVGGVITSDIRQNQNKTADLRPDTGTSLRLLTSLPAGGLTKNSSAAAVPLSSSSSSSGGNDDDDRERNRRRDLHAEREILRIQNLKAKALSRFQEKHPGEVEPSLVNLWLDAIEERAKKQIVSENYFLRALENEFHQHAESTVSETRERIPAQDSANGKSDRGARLFWADKFAKSVAVSVEKAREKVLEVRHGTLRIWSRLRQSDEVSSVQRQIRIAGSAAEI